MKNLILFVVISFASFSTSAQLRIPSIKYTSDYKKFESNSLVQSLVNEGGVLIMYHVYTSLDMDTQFRGIYYGKDRIWHYCAFVNKNGEKAILPILIPQNSIIKLWKAFVDNNIFSLMDEKQAVEKCKEMIYDSQYLNFVIITKTHYKSLTYYDPEFFEGHCPGNEDRKKIINCAKVVFSHEYWQKIN